MKIKTVTLKGVPSLRLFGNLFNQLKGATILFLGVLPRSFFFFNCDSRIRFIKECAAYTYKLLTVEGQNLNSRYDTDQGQVLIRRRTFTVLDRTPNQGYHRFTLESASPQRSTVLTEKSGSPKRPLQPL